MRHTRLVLLTLVGLLLPATLRGQEQVSFGSRLVDALTRGTVGMTARYRFEFVNDKAFTRDGFASTLRTTLGYRTGTLHGFSGYLQFEDVSDLGAAESHNNAGSGHLANGVTSRPVVADPAVTSVHQAYLQFARDGITVSGGRFVVNLDDQRFIGAVGWRQHQQSFDGLRVDGSWGAFDASVLLLDDVHRIAGNQLKLSSGLVHARYRIAGLGALTGYAYLLDYDEVSAVGLSTNTFGGELAGTRSLDGDWDLRYEAEYAHQRDAADNPSRIRAEYAHLMGGASHRGYGLRVGWERLGGNPMDGRFQTPLATLHAFNGWADKFLSTPANGLEDLYVRAEGPVGPLSALLVYHDFRPATGGGKYGTELDAQATFRAAWGQLFGVKAAVYDAKDFSSDATKFWAFTQWSF